MKTKVLSPRIAGVLLAYAPLVSNRLDGWQHGLNLNRPECDEVRFEALRHCSLFAHRVDGVRKVWAMIFVGELTRPFLVDLMKIQFDQFPFAQGADLMERAKKLVLGLCRRAPAMSIDRGTFNFLSGQPVFELEREVAALATAIGSVLFEGSDLNKASDPEPAPPPLVGSDALPADPNAPTRPYPLLEEGLPGDPFDQPTKRMPVAGDAGESLVPDAETRAFPIQPLKGAIGPFRPLLSDGEPGSASERETTSFPVLGLGDASPGGDGQMTCPKCGYRGPFAEECPNCGVLVRKALKSAGRVMSAPSRSTQARPERAGSGSGDKVAPGVGAPALPSAGSPGPPFTHSPDPPSQAAFRIISLDRLLQLAFGLIGNYGWQLAGITTLAYLLIIAIQFPVYKLAQSYPLVGNFLGLALGFFYFSFMMIALLHFIHHSVQGAGSDVLDALKHGFLRLPSVIGSRLFALLLFALGIFAFGFPALVYYCWFIFIETVAVVDGDRLQICSPAQVSRNTVRGFGFSVGSIYLFLYALMTLAIWGLSLLAVLSTAMGSSSGPTSFTGLAIILGGIALALLFVILLAGVTYFLYLDLSDRQGEERFRLPERLEPMTLFVFIVDGLLAAIFILLLFRR